MIKSLAKLAGWNRYSNGLWLPGMAFGGLGPACCCTLDPCTACTDTPNDILVDLGSGGWTNAGCDTCATIHETDHVVSKQLTNIECGSPGYPKYYWRANDMNQCLWNYYPHGHCYPIERCDVYIGLMLYRNGYAWSWISLVQMQALGLVGGTSAYYQSESVTSSTCPSSLFDFPVTLNRISEVQNGPTYSCDGHMAESITLNNV